MGAIFSNGFVGENWWQEIDRIQLRLIEVENKISLDSNINTEEIAILKNEISNIKQALDSKANIIQEPWKDASLLNNWANVNGYGLQYKKNTLGEVKLRGRVTSGDTGKAICILPAEYRPSRTVIIPVCSDTSPTVILVGIWTNGEVRHYTGSTINVVLDNVEYVL